jgi:hypothetical protein
MHNVQRNRPVASDQQNCCNMRAHQLQTSARALYRCHFFPFVNHSHFSDKSSRICNESPFEGKIEF